jgi:hypothetical protein
MRITTDEEKVAKQISKLISDVRLDLEVVGYYLTYFPTSTIRRLGIIVDKATEEPDINVGG